MTMRSVSLGSWNRLANVGLLLLVTACAARCVLADLGIGDSCQSTSDCVDDSHVCVLLDEVDLDGDRVCMPLLDQDAPTRCEKDDDCLREGLPVDAVCDEARGTCACDITRTCEDFDEQFDAQLCSCSTGAGATGLECGVDGDCQIRGGAEGDQCDDVNDCDPTSEACVTGFAGQGFCLVRGGDAVCSSAIGFSSAELQAVGEGFVEVCVETDATCNVGFCE